MLKKINIKNFQKHSKLSLALHKGINVIAGRSDVGKSSILRAIKWAVTNRPSGDSFRKKGTTYTGVQLVTTNGSVLREKGKGKNQYVVGKEPLKALRTDVPEDVSILLNMGSENIQSQHETYFLLDKSPGQVAKELNKVVGLDEMDRSLKQINSDTRSITSEQKFVKGELDKLDMELKETEWLPEAVQSIEDIKLLAVEHNKQEVQLNKLEAITTEISNIESKLEESNLDKADASFSILEQRISELSDVHKKCTELNNICIDIESVEQYLKNKPPEIDFIEIEQDIQDCKKLKRRITQLSNTVSGVERCASQLGELSSDIIYLEEDITKILSEFEECPFCLQEMP